MSLHLIQWRGGESRPDPGTCACKDLVTDLGSEVQGGWGIEPACCSTLVSVLPVVGVEKTSSFTISFQDTTYCAGSWGQSSE